MYFWNMQNEKVKVKYFSENESDFSQIILSKCVMDVCENIIIIFYYYY